MPDIEYLRDLISGLVTIPHDGDMVDWADGVLRIPYSVRYPIFMAHESPWLLEPMRAASDMKVRRVDVRAPAGSAKSLIGEVHIAHCITEAPGMYYYVWQTDDDGKDAMEDRIFPMLEANDFLMQKMPLDRSKKRTTKIAFPHMSFYSVGAKPSKAQSKRVKYLTMEEPHLYDPGMMSAFEKRVEGVKESKILTLSTGSVMGDESDEAFNQGTCEEWNLPCPHCGHFQAMTDSRERLLAQIDKETMDEHGQYVWPKITPTVRYNCEKCAEDWPSDEEFRKRQSKDGIWVATNLNAPSDHRSFHMEALSVYYFPLAKILKEKLEASRAAKRGALKPLEDYVQKRRAAAWDGSPVDSDDALAWDRSKGEYKMGDPFDGEIVRFLTVDNQAGRASKGDHPHRWAECRAYGQHECRLIWAGRINTWELLEEKRIELGVEPLRTLVDIAFDTQAVQEVCVRYGWQGLWGDTTSKQSFPHHEKVLINGKPAHRTRHLPFSPPQIGHTGVGKSGERRQARFFFWCQLPIKDMWHSMKKGLTTYRWTVAQDAPDAYRDQTSVETKRLTIEKKTGRKVWGYFVPSGKDNHFTDTGQMSLVSALLDPRIREILWTFTDAGDDEDPPPPNET